MKIPFSPPFVDDSVEEEVLSCLRSGWITSGPKVKALEDLCASFAKVDNAVAVNSWSSGALLVYKWLGLKPGDEVIVPAYTYSATALSVIHSNAKVVMVDVLDDFTIDPEAVKKAITANTKAVVAVDIAGWPCDYNALKAVLEDPTVNSLFSPSNDVQAQLARPLLLSDAAHSIGATYFDQPAARASDITIFSLHAVKNVTTAEGGIICLNLPGSFTNLDVYKWMKLNALNGQTKDAFTKTTDGGWRYDIVSAGLKINMPDICAAIGLAQLRKYPDILLSERERVYNHYANFFSQKTWAIMPPGADANRKSSFHLFPLRIKDITEAQRDQMIEMVKLAGVSTNVHFVPMPMFTLFKNMGFEIDKYPVAFRNYAAEISLPIYPQLTNNECAYIETHIEQAYLAVTQLVEQLTN